MARTVKIPDCSSTFDVFLNGIKHSFLGGTEVEVEDEVANLIEQHIKEHTPKEAPKTVGPFNSTFCNIIIWDEDKKRIIVGGEESPELIYSGEDSYTLVNNEWFAKIMELVRRGVICLRKRIDSGNKEIYHLYTGEFLRVDDYSVWISATVCVCAEDV